MLPYRANWITVTILAVFFIGIIGYASFEARDIIEGPEIALGSLAEPRVVHDQMILVRGVAKNIAEIRMNGRVIPTTEAGAFEEAHLLSEGYNAILLSARDKIGRTTEERIEVVYEPLVISTTASTTENSL